MIRRRSRPARPALNPGADIDAIRDAVHGRLRGCRWCGAPTRLTPAPDGWPACSDCAAGVARWGDGWPTAAAAALVEADPADLDPFAWGRLTAPSWADQPDAHPDRPGAGPWAHLDRLARADLFDLLRTLTAEAHRLAAGGPCHRCGAAYSDSWTGAQGSVLCATCATDGSDGPRRIDHVAADLVGVVGAPDGFAAEVGFTWWADTPGAEPGHPWAYLDLDALRARAVAVVPWRSRWRDRGLASRLGVGHGPPVTYERHEAGPCRRCGITSSSGWWRGPLCARCYEDPSRDRYAADLVAARLAGLRGCPDDCAEVLGFAWWADTKRAATDPRRRFAYVDRTALRARADDAGLDLAPAQR